jgi:hypothetical protein
VNDTGRKSIKAHRILYNRLAEMSKVVRSVKNVTKGYSSVQVKVRNATSNDPWGPTGTEMSEIAALTFSSPTDFYEIMDMLDKRLNDKRKKLASCTEVPQGLRLLPP